MEYVEGVDLAERVQVRGPLPVAEACYYAFQAAQGLEHAYSRGMVHRDIKPANLILDLKGARGVVKILDFGLAKVGSEGAVDGELTRQGLMLGTPDYMAPEQIRSAQRADIRADIYGLGCTLYFLLSGRPPFDGDSLYDILQAHHSSEASPLDLVRPDVPVELAAVVAKMMAKDPSHRFQTPREVAETLVPFFRGEGAGSRRPATKVTRGDPTGPSGGSAQDRPEADGGTPVAWPHTAAEPTAPEARWVSLIDLGEEGRSRVTTRPAEPHRQPF